MQRKSRPLTMPFLAIAGAASRGELIPNAMKELANDVQGVVLPGTGHWVAEESPNKLLAALTPFLDPYRDASAAAHTPRPRAATASRSLG
jgi:pimeloyl-ACP methyl ester carboxylesterase